MALKGRRRRRQGRHFFLENFFLNFGGHYITAVVSAILFAALIFIGVLGYQNTDYNDLLSRGRRQLAEGKVALAEQTFKTLTSHYNSYEGHVELGKVYLELHERKKAEYHFRKAAEMKPRDLDSSSAEIASSKLAVTRHRFDEAEKQLTAVYKKIPNDKDLNLALYELYEEWGDYLGEQQDYLTSIDKYELALRYVNDYDEEKELKGKLIDILSRQAKQKEKEQKLDDAIVLLERSLRYRYESGILAQIAEMYERNGKLDDSINWYRKAFDANPEEVSIKLARLLIARGKDLLRQKQPDKADEYFDEADMIFKRANVPLNEVYPVELAEFKVTPQLNYNTGMLLLSINMKVQNKAHRQLPFLATKVMFYSGDTLLNEMTEIVASPSEPLPGDGDENSAKVLKIVPEDRINVHSLSTKTLRIKVGIAYTQDENAEWEIIGTQEIKLKGDLNADTGFSA